MGNPGPAGQEITVNSLYFEKAGNPWIGVMGEYHFSRDKKENWYRELCKMKAGGVTIAATYAFWIYHEEMEGEYDFSGDLDLRAFIEDCQRAGLYLILRIGPWAHGECRNGGFPDWLMRKPFPLRDNNEGYLALAREWYEKLYAQAQGLFYQDGGPVIGIQIENELVDNSAHLLVLKQLAAEVGFDVPLYTVTGWNSKYGAKIPVEEVVPVFAAYAEAPWEQHIDRLPLSRHYVFDPMRNDAAVGMDLLKKADDDGWQLPYGDYPFATCELGAGLPFSHHRRPVISGMDAYALSLVKLGSGNNLVGYYMYHGGTNRIGRLSTFQESRETGYPNDYAILNYDFHTALTQYGEAREQYRLLNLLHLFVNDFGGLLAPMVYQPEFPLIAPEDTKSLRIAVRQDADGGFVFINHYQRLQPLEDLAEVRIETDQAIFPPIRVAGEIAFILPFGLRFAGQTIRTATAQLLCGQDNTLFFAAIPGIAPRYEIDGEGVHDGDAEKNFTVGALRIVTVSWEEALRLRKLEGKVYLGEACDLFLENGQVTAIREGSFSYRKWEGASFVRYDVERESATAVLLAEPEEEPFAPPYESELQIGGPRKRSWKKLHVTSASGFVEITDRYDVAQIYADGELAADNFYAGEPWRVPAALLYGKNCHLVMAEEKNDYYREF
ncbi:MAG: beta-galactosidase [Lachnospiraceae bacterium]|nr:beta-galactosidase [Lachnospiraceae bacterium]